MAEFERIARYLQPLAGEGAMELRDDAARAYGRVLTKDVLVEGTHFLPGDPIDLLARKALRVNASDLIAKGAEPEAYMLGLVWPEARGEAEFASFCDGLRVEQELTGLELLGGDTTRGPCLMISVTMFGVRTGPEILRSGGEVGDMLMVTGTIGDGLLALEAAKEGQADAAAAYYLPPVPYGAEFAVSAHANAALDVSDGLIADTRHLAEESKIGIRLFAGRIPLSAAGKKAASEGRLPDLLTGGDDYQSLMLCRVEEKISDDRFTVIGEAMDGLPPGHVEVLMPDGELWVPEKGGWDHFTS
ncbi:thiamine-phosphate kinase [Parvularcula sp. ZS-1/3]|uniref:Thiamine-monophosphate kinase n=1 Tax=Parvularcula mediterranea TaxID=2732508 RepID=A0A7Y3RMJ4_9PROT|nr:thiamine-phosphate kinase [Parvularcula mediterranea]NNU16331.1 thiamine-phosphate kinase [Parvularcula mediterranea]